MAIKELMFFLLMLFARALESKMLQNSKVLVVNNANGIGKGPKEEMRDKINTIKALLDEVSSLADICGACDSNPCLNDGTCVEEVGGKYSCSCAAGWTGKKCEVCHTALGMENGKISDSQITASSSEAEHGGPRGRLHFEVSPGKPGSWSARVKDDNQWLQVDLGKWPRNVTAIATQGGTNYREKPRWVTSYKLKYSDDGVNFHFYKEQGQSAEKEFGGNKDRDSVVYHELSPPISARYIRVCPTQYKTWIAMRVEFYGCREINPCDSQPCFNEGNCTSQAGGNYSCQCAIGWMGDKCQDINTVGEIRDSAILRNNEAHLTKLSEWLKPVVQSGHHWKLCWRASRDGWAVSTFHSNCNYKGPTVTIIKVDKYIFGGYTSVSWASSCSGYKTDSKAFLFSLVNKPGWGPLKLSQPGASGDYSYSKSIFDCFSYGPTFGNGHDLTIFDQAGSNTNSYSNLGSAYSSPTGYSFRSTFAQTFLAGSYNFQPDEVETFYEST